MAVIAESPSSDLDSSPLKRVLQGLKDFWISPRWLAAVIFISVWHIVSVVMNTRVVPRPALVFNLMWKILSTGLFFEHLGASLVRILSGFVVCLVIGTAVGVIMGSRRSWEPIFKDLVIIFLTMPGLIYALLSVMFFGLSLMAPVIAVAAGSFPIVAVNIREGVRSLNKDLLDMGQVYHVSRRKIVTQIILPALLPFFLAAIRTSFAIAWKISTLVEVFGAQSGVGYMIRSGFDAFSVTQIAAWSLLFGGVMLGIEYGILDPADRYLARWRPKVGRMI
jgi:NitT/TauT family transport system permease protein